MTITRVAVNGAAGRMGQMLVAAVAATEDLRLTAALEHPASPHVGANAGQLAGVETGDIAISADLTAALPAFDVLIDFSVPDATLVRLGPCADNGKGMVIGTTGFDAAGQTAIDQTAQRAPIVMAPNMSVGVNVAFQLIEAATRALGDEVDVEVFEAHHRHKIDAPSGTAARMGEIIAEALGRDLAADAVYGRAGNTGERPRRAIGFHSLRAGDIVGEHTVVFAGVGERIEITHRAASRENFAAGALRATRFVAAKLAAGEPGLFGMDAVLGLP